MKAQAIATPRHAVRPRAVRRPTVGALLARSAVWFFVIAATTYFCSTLISHTLMEQARREALRAKERARAATADLALLKDQRDRLASDAEMNRWAKRRGFTLGATPAESPREVVRVAQR